MALNVLHLSTADSIGGSGRSAYRLHEGLKRRGVRSTMLVGRKFTDAADVTPISHGWLARLDRACGRVTDRLGLQYLCLPSSLLLPYRRAVRQADVVQLYNTHGGYLSHVVLPALSRRRPVVWRLSDMWPMTGHCGYAYDCERWRTGCGACPNLEEYPELRRDRTALLWRIKGAVYRRSRLTLVAPSRWIARLAAESPLLRDMPMHVIPNGLDTTLFTPASRAEARARLGLPSDVRVILFSATPVSHPRKGAPVLRQALERLALVQRDSTLVLVVGSHAETWQPDGPFPVRRIDTVRDERTMAAVYSAADLMALPTQADTLPNGALEAMACGTPVVSFDVGGVSEAVRHTETGYLATAGDVEDFAQGLHVLLKDDELRERLGRRAREVIEREYAMDRQVDRFLALYHEVRDAWRP